MSSVVVSESAEQLEQQAKFDRELDWCIQKLSGRILQEKDQRKANELIKNLHALKSPSTLMIKKRQVMFNVFGDYRTKMKQDESKKTKQQTKISFTNSNKTDPTDGKCLKKKTDSIVVPLIAEKSTTPFKFEFKIPE